MKLLLTSDLHYNLQQFDWLIRNGQHYDYVIVAGDLLNIAGYLELEVQITVISEYLRNLSRLTNVIVCSGNHDGETRNRQGEFNAAWLQKIASETLFVDWQAVRAPGVLISICPWWDGHSTKAKMVAMLEDHAEMPHKKWVWIHHAPPDRCRVSWTGKRFGGDPFLNVLIKKHSPTLVFSGHIHSAPFYEKGGWVDRLHETWVCNPGNQPGAIPTTIQFDLDEMKAIFDSSEGREWEMLE